MHVCLVIIHTVQRDLAFNSQLTLTAAGSVGYFFGLKPIALRIIQLGSTKWVSLYSTIERQ